MAHTKIKFKSFNKSLLSLAVVGLLQPAYAAQEDATEENVEVISVKGLRGSLMQAQDIKRESDTFVDAISAKDIGALPDRSVLEAMSRIPGVSIERFAAADDPDHFGIEGSGAVIRGMTQTRSEFNGRDTFSANSNRGLSFQDVPPELMGSVKVYKNQSADMIEGGIGGTVNLITKLPFDSAGRQFGVSLDATYTDMAEEWSPSGSALYSDQWETDAGKFGFLINLAYSDLTSRSDGMQSEIVLDRDDLVAGSTVYAPNGGNMNSQIQDRNRQGYALAGQWENTDRTLLATAQFLRSDSSLAWTERTMSYQGQMWADDGIEIRRESGPVEGTQYEFDENGVFQSGWITDKRGWRSNDGEGGRAPNLDSVGFSGFGNTFQTTTRVKEQTSLVDDLSFNFKYRPSDSWSHELDIQFIDAQTNDDDVTLFLGLEANQFLDLSGDIPRVEFANPYWGNTAENIAAAGVTDRANNENFLQDKSFYHWRSAMDHYERSEGDEFATKWDSKYVFDRGFLVSVKAGIRYAKRDQTVRFSAYNWGDLGALHSTDVDENGYRAAWLDLPEHASLANDVDQFDWDNHMDSNGYVTIPGMGYTLHPSLELVQDYANWGTRLSDVMSGGWEPAADRDPGQLGVDDNGNPVFEEFDGHFRPAEVTEFTETNTAAYVRFDFAYDDWIVPFTGNFGGRYVMIERDTSGFLSFPDLRSKEPIYDAEGEEIIQAINLIDSEDTEFGDYSAQSMVQHSEDSYFLPSLNLKFELDDDLISRFAVSKALAYPNTGDMKAYTRISAQVVPVRGEPTEESPDGELTAANVVYSAQSGNPNLKPMQSTQYDLSLEWYYSDDGSLTGTIFYKDLKDFWIRSGVNQTFTNPNTGVSQTISVAQPTNAQEGTMKGIELAYQQFFNFLPTPFDGLGMQANYSYIKASGVPNSNLFTTSTDGAADTSSGGSGEIVFDELPLQGQSKHTANLVGMYQTDHLEARIAYNWRSSYMITSRDVIDPNRPIFGEAAGYLDASVFYDLNENIKVGIQGVNLLDTVTETTMQTDNAGSRYGRSWFVNDRRVSLIFRAQY